MSQVGGFVLDQPSSPAVSKKGKGKGKEVAEEYVGSDDIWAEFGDNEDYSVLLEENPSLLNATT